MCVSHAITTCESGPTQEWHYARAALSKIYLCEKNALRIVTRLEMKVFSK